MIFATDNAVEDILAGRKTQTRRLVKENENTWKKCGSCSKFWAVKKNNKIKWQVGRDYAVQVGRGKPRLWYCPKCKSMQHIASTYQFDKFNYFCWKHHIAEPLRIRITGIRKERLKEISEDDAKKEGFENRYRFWQAFDKINRYNTKEDADFPNPEVWVLDFEVKK